ncbi:MAG: triose-phosphate isomerase [Chitinophagales bacterium]|nr:triose-phosphate isomerase [Chitinophagales bacterium]MCZ2394359.1 triose-phosphate isomerase [Chitinophagales bacterium]
MRKNIVAANWKMNKNHPEAIELIQSILFSQIPKKTSTFHQVIIATPYLYLREAVLLSQDFPHLYIAAQNCHHQSMGAYTGEIAAQQLESIGVTHVIIGHSERRAYFNEIDEVLLQKIKQALQHHLIPLFCCGEPLEIREANTHLEYIQTQLANTVFQLNPKDFSNIIIAYEPIWAIGTGQTATVAQAQEVHAFIRKLITDKFGTDIAENTSILYGGSCNAQNASSLFAQKDIDGGLIGGASLIAKDFETIVLSNTTQ